MLDFNVDFGEFQKDISENIMDLIQQVGEIVLEEENLDGDFEVSLSFVDDEEIQALNLEYRGKNSSTDVLSFPMFEEQELKMLSDNSMIPHLLGDIIISLPTAKRQAAEYEHSLKREVCFLVCHSMLHLLGYDHIEEDERVRMEKKQKEIMNKAGIKREF